MESDHAQDSLNLEHFLRRTGVHFGGKCSGFAARYFRTAKVWLFLNRSIRKARWSKDIARKAGSD